MRTELADTLARTCMRGIIARWDGSRLHPITHAVGKQLMPVYDKPMIYYPLSTLMLAGIREGPRHHQTGGGRAVQAAFGDGSQFGIQIGGRSKPQPDKLAQAFLIGEVHIAGEHCTALVLRQRLHPARGWARGLGRFRQPAGGLSSSVTASRIFGHGVVEFDATGRSVVPAGEPDDRGTVMQCRSLLLRRRSWHGRVS